MNESEDRGELVPELILRIGGEDDKRDYVKLRGDHGDCGPAGGLRGRWSPLPEKVGVFVVLGSVGDYSNYNLGDKDIQYSSACSSCLCFCCIISHPTFTIVTFYVGGWYDFWLWLWISSNHVSSSCGCISSIFHWLSLLRKIQGWLEKYPKRASVLRSAGEGNWFHQFRAVTLIRISPFPYIIYNYCAVASNVKYAPYLLGSLAGMVPETFVAIYTGILIRTLADASHEHHGLSAPQIIFTVVGFSLTVATTIFFTVYAKRQLKELQKDDEPLLQ
ncbi:transmembrane protein 64 [Prunus yedoensis var. nudiflora]|uniref:Transmembrane protein 64 n=1 Tax=Prunus yedoensis var. nudiflora TaxID=2094558 RepID=A0A314YC28_PRUYE|nr:transmembrane protein 64 [Prunus yedoensis var. nudiflora]